MEIRLAADLQEDSIVDGEGIRTVLWTQGCPHHCPGCHNPQTHDFSGGLLVDVEDVKDRIDELKGQDGLTFSGGDPFVQAKACAEIARYARSLGLNIWCYTGYTYEHLVAMAKEKAEIIEFLNEIDILVDGKFLLEKKSYSALFRGSTNQRLIDVKESLKQHMTVLKKEEEEEIFSFTPRKQQGLYV
ncbi:MAG: anaerobic ribonucleoside-triphosphate reductase activating protein [Bacilli bacterium]|nr:anaerobic ribonucleoside-triphosphate reductase activating protein [Bacilli bacterium]